VSPATVVLAVFPVIFVGELPDKSMFASLVLASRGRALGVWIGSAGAFLVHVVIATTIGVGLFKVLPSRVLDILVAVMFLAGAGYAWFESTRDESGLIERETGTHQRAAIAAFLVIFIAEWGDLTQILIANFAAKFHEALYVAIGALAALWTVSALAVTTGQGLLARLPVQIVRRVTAVILLVLAIITAISAARA
jgi:putative Ca2+/H+ antiporter (TMEM165/GDT1 family)